MWFCLLKLLCITGRSMVRVRFLCGQTTECVTECVHLSSTPTSSLINPHLAYSLAPCIALSHSESPCILLRPPLPFSSVSLFSSSLIFGSPPPFISLRLLPEQHTLSILSTSYSLFILHKVRSVELSMSFSSTALTLYNMYSFPLLSRSLPT